MSNKIYPKIGQDNSGKKFFFSSNNKHYTIRFSWKPMILIEKYFVYFWWTKEIFLELYNWLTSKTKIKDELIMFIPILRQAIKRLEELNDVLNICADENKSPLVIYENEYNSFK